MQYSSVPQFQRHAIKPLAHFACAILLALIGFATPIEAGRPNILWVVVDDMSANFSCYGDSTIQTPNVDSLARNGLRFDRAYATSPVCSTFRSSLITGMYQTTIGAHHHRSGRGKHRITLPAGVVPLPKLFQQAGYYTCMGSGLKDLDYRSQIPTKSRSGALAKSDYNFTWDRAIFDGNDWSGREAEQPFFMQIQLHGGKLRGASESSYTKFEHQVAETLGASTNPSSVQLPPHYPEDAIIQRDWANYLDSVLITDWHLGKVMQRLQEEGLRENTLIIFFTDHGISHARGKQFLYDEGTHIPLILSGPGIVAGTLRDDLVEHIDIAALSLAAASIPVPVVMQGQNILSKTYRHREFAFAARDRCGEADDRIRSARSDKFLYVRNFYPSRPHLMPSTYKDGKLIIQRLRELHQAGTLDSLAERLLFSPTRPNEELYLYQQDPWQFTNLANSANYLPELKRHRNALKQWIRRTADPGAESDEIYMLEVQDQMSSTKNAATREQFRKNSEIYQTWRAEGK